MENLLEYLSIGVSFAAIILMLTVLLVNIYLIKREGFRVSVNCWFCNSWTKVLYSNRNSFECPSCLQYNGFTKDGGYNKVINAQHDTSFTKSVANPKAATNGLCTLCNNNQRLKIHQLANFVPLNENSYDVEIEHFRKQLDKSYKLCGKCERVLKTTLNQQHAWLFGNRLKNIKNNTLKAISLNKQICKNTNLLLMRYLLSVLNILILCYLLNVKIEFPTLQNTKQFVPSYLSSYTLIVNEYYHLMKNGSKNFAEEIIDLDKFNFETNFLGVISTMGFLLHVFLVFGEHFSNWWKINEMLVWIILFCTSSVPLDSRYSGQIKVLQVFTSVGLLYSYVKGKSLPKPKNSCQFKKIKEFNDISEEIDEDYEENIHSSFCSVKSRKPNLTNDLNTSHCQFYRASSPLSNCQSQNGFVNSFSTDKTALILNSSGSLSPHNELHRSLDNLHLNNLNFRPQPCSSPVFSVNSTKRPVLTPPKLRTVTQNPWTAGGFWKNDVTAYQVGIEETHPSRSSSQSSGFVSNQPFNSLPASREHSLSGDVERTSILSEPTYHINSFSSKSPKSLGQQLYYKADNNTFYPILNQNNMLFLQGNVPSFVNSFSTASLNSPPPRPTVVPSPVLFTDKPISGLFKNFHTSGVSDNSFSTARF